jgi:23S rRNA (guanine745-N1)-methyltransferase
MPQLICPVCSLPLNLQDKSYRCEKGHCFDRAKSGYVNLLPPAPGGKRHGDDKLMVKARTDFLDKGFYDPMAAEVARRSAECNGDFLHIVDAGCGEGKYTVDVLNYLRRQGRDAHIVGIDISKEALICAARRSRDLTLCVASTAHMPLADGSADVVLNIFSPLMAEEFSRVLKPTGRLICVVPLERHLWELKELIYDTPYENPAPNLELPSFALVDRTDLRYEIELNSGEEISSLFKMTPYYYKTGAADQQKAEQAQHLKTTVEFGVLVYGKDAG